MLIDLIGSHMDIEIDMLHITMHINLTSMFTNY